MKEVLWTRIDDHSEAGRPRKALTLFRRQLVDTPRGRALEDVPVLTVEGISSQVEKDYDGDAAELELEVQIGSTAGAVVVAAMIAPSAMTPVDPELPRVNFDHPPDEKKRKMRGMSRFVSAEDQKVSTAPGNPPVPPEQRNRRRQGPRLPTRPATPPKR